MSPSLQETFTARNLSTRDNWAAFQGHRENIKRVLDQYATTQSQSVCVLGAGNCLDLDLRWMSSRFKRLHLVDLDGESLRLGVENQLPSGEANVTWQAEDATGAFSLLNDLVQHRAEFSQGLEDLKARLNETPLAGRVPERFDVVLSTCLLSQLIDALRMAVPERDPHFLPLVLAIRRQHLATMLSLLNPSGTLILVSDFVSSLTCPELSSLSDERLSEYAHRQIERHNFFTGLNPLALKTSLEALLPVGSGKVISLGPWKWDLGPRVYLVAALVARLP